MIHCDVTELKLQLLELLVKNEKMFQYNCLRVIQKSRKILPSCEIKRNPVRSRLVTSMHIGIDVAVLRFPPANISCATLNPVCRAFFS